MYIENLKDLRITKIKYNKILFRCKDKRYAIVFNTDSDDVVPCITLYKRESVEGKDAGYYHLEEIASVPPTDNIYSVYTCINTVCGNGKRVVYGQIDYIRFIKHLTYIGLVDSIYNKELKVLRNRIKSYEEEIKKHEEEIKKLRKKIIKEKQNLSDTRGAGLKEILAPSYEERYNRKHRNEIYNKVGDLCKQFIDEHGNYMHYGDKKYGGTLTDLRTLDNEARFHCCNGNWDGIVYINSQGDKCVAVISDNNTNKEKRVTEENQAMFITVN